MGITLTQAATKRVADLVAGEKEAIALRIGVIGGGCNGFNYTFSFSAEINDDDVVNNDGGATVVIDPVSIMYLDGASLDYITDIGGEQFTLNNPLAQTQCGCGSSFSV